MKIPKTILVSGTEHTPVARLSIVLYESQTPCHLFAHLVHVHTKDAQN